MTSSFRATGAASVRQTPAGEVASPGLWTLNELAVPTPNGGIRPVDPVAAKALAAEEKSRLIDEGYARGLADGERKGLNAAQSRVTESLAALTNVATRMQDTSSLATAVLEENIATLAVVVARQILAREVSLDAGIVTELVRRALTEFPIEQTVRIHVNPQDLAAITVAAGLTEAPSITANREASWLPDPKIARGGCMIEGRDRIIDGRVDTALARAYLRMAKQDAA
jgi:flagellar biosynthesis/type III secretory pathway protein FliH